MSAPTIPGVEELEKLFAAPSRPCESREHDHQPCPNPADWRLTMRCCGHVGLICDMHYQHFLAREGHLMLRCQGCGWLYTRVSEAVSAVHRL